MQSSRFIFDLFVTSPGTDCQLEAGKGFLCSDYYPINTFLSELKEARQFYYKLKLSKEELRLLTVDLNVISSEFFSNTPSGISEKYERLKDNLLEEACAYLPSEETRIVLRRTEETNEAISLKQRIWGEYCFSQTGLKVKEEAYKRKLRTSEGELQAVCEDAQKTKEKKLEDSDWHFLCENSNCADLIAYQNL